MVIYQESQRFNVVWVIVVVSAVALFMLYASFQQFVLGEPFGQHPAPDVGLFTITLFTVIVAVIVSFQKLETEVTDKGIYFQLIPFQWRKRFIAWSDIERIELVTYDAYKEYAGYGYRVSVKGNGRALIISGNSGLMVYRKTKKPLLIGTQNTEELLGKMNEIKQLV